MVAEWNDQPRAICGAGFDMDFYLDWPGNGYNALMRDYECRQDDEDHSYYRKDGKGDISRFLEDYLPKPLHFADWFPVPKQPESGCRR